MADFSTTSLLTIHVYTHGDFCSLLKTGRKTTFSSIALHKKKVQLFIEDKCMYVRTVILMLGYTWQVTSHAVYNDNHVYRLSYAVFFCEYSHMHSRGALIYTHVLTRNVPANILRASSFMCTRRGNHEISQCISCEGITT